MKKDLGLTSLALLGALSLTGCSCFSEVNLDGTYEFSYIKYEENDIDKTTTCEDTLSLSERVQTLCSAAQDVSGFVIEGNKMYPVNQEDEVLYFKLVGDSFYFSTTEDGEYVEDDMYEFENGKIYIDLGDAEIVLEKE